MIEAKMIRHKVKCDCCREVNLYFDEEDIKYNYNYNKKWGYIKCPNCNEFMVVEEYEDYKTKFYYEDVEL